MSELHAVAPLEESDDGPPLFLAVAHRQLLRGVLDDTAATRECAHAAMTRVEQDIDYLWRDSLSLNDQALTESLAVVGHALRQVGRLLDAGNRIG